MNVRNLLIIVVVSLVLWAIAIGASMFIIRAIDQVEWR